MVTRRCGICGQSAFFRLWMEQPYQYRVIEFFVSNRAMSNRGDPMPGYFLDYLDVIEFLSVINTGTCSIVTKSGDDWIVDTRTLQKFYSSYVMG